MSGHGASPGMDARAVGYAAGLTAAALFGLSDALVRAASIKLRPAQNLLISLLVGTPLLWIVALATGPLKVTGEAAALYALAGLLNFVAGRLLFYYAISFVGATTAAISTSPTVVLSSLLAWLILGESLTAYQLVGVLLIMGAILLISGSPSGSSLHGGRSSLGIAAGLASTLTFALSAILVRAASAYMGSNPVYGVAVSYTASIPPAILLTRNPGESRANSRRHFYYMVLAAVLVALAQLARYVAFQEAVVVEAASVMALYPFFTLLSTLLLSRHLEEKPSPIHLLAAALAVVGVIAVNHAG